MEFLLACVIVVVMSMLKTQLGFKHNYQASENFNEEIKQTLLFSIWQHLVIMPQIWFQQHL